MPAPANLVHQTSVSTGTGTFTLVAVNGKQGFANAFSTGGSNVFDYFISNRDAAEYERGTGHMSDSTTLVRDTIIESTNSNNAVNFSAGTKDVTNDVPALTQVRGPGSSTDNAIAAFSGTSGGLLKVAASLGSLVGVQLLDTTGTYTPTSGTGSALLFIQGAGGGGGGVGTSNGQGIGGGGAAGETRLYVLTGVTGTYSYTIGALGAGATAGNNSGGTGGDTTFGTGPLVTSKGGTGGAGTAGATSASSGTTPTGSGGVLLPGTDGPHSASNTSIRGGGCIFGLGGALVATLFAYTAAGGNPASGKGAGGCGGCHNGTSAVGGGAGTAGCILVLEFK